MTPFPIVDLGPEEQIVEQGLYRLPLSQHHAQPAVGPSVTSGVLRKMELQSPADVWAFHQLNPNRWESQDRPALRLGRAMAAFLEDGMKAVAEHFVVLPADKPNRPTEKQLTAYEEGRASDAAKKSIHFWERWDADPRDQISAADMATIADMGMVLAKDPMASAVMSGLPEISMAWQDEMTGLWCLSRPDVIAFDGTAVDYKRCNTQGRPFNHAVCDQRIEQHGYFQQMAFAAEAYEILTGEWPGQVGLVFQWDQPPHHIILREVEEEALRYGQMLNRRALIRFAECLASGKWPGPGDDVGFYQMSERMRARMLRDMEMGAAA